MAMKESQNSLRAYFFLAGVFGCIVNFRALTRGNNTIVSLSFSGASILASIGLVLAAWFLTELLRGRLGLLKGLLLGIMGLNLIKFIFLALLNPTPMVFVGPAVSVVIGAYLLTNVSRLARELTPKVPVADPF